MGLPLDADALVVDAGQVLLVLDEPVLTMQLLPLVILNVIPSTHSTGTIDINMLDNFNTSVMFFTT
jgi:hypothetical protein